MLVFIGTLAAEAYLGHRPLTEFAVLFVPIMTVPFAFVLAAVYVRRDTRTAIAR